MKRKKIFAWVMPVLAVLALVCVPGTAKAVPGEVLYTGTNTGLYDDDDYAGPIPIGFSFHFYGATYTDLSININGELNFGSPSDEFSNYPLPSDSEGPSVQAFWDDIITQNWEDQSIYYRTIGSPGSRKFIVQWTNMYFFSDPDMPMGTFQAILYEGTNKIQLQYRDLLGGDAAKGNSATIGINKDGTTAQQVSFDDAILNQGQAISFTPAGEDNYTVNTSASYDLVYLSDAAAPGTPVLSSPASGSHNVETAPTFTWEAASLADSYQLLVATDADFADVVINESGITDTHYSPDTPLDENTTYYWKVGAVNEVSSALSETSSFTTVPPDDHDGTSAAVEAAAPNDGDANNDGTQDSLQANVTSILDAVNNHYVSLAAAGCTGGNTGVSAAAGSATDTGYTYPAGLLSFTVACAEPGDTATITQYFYGVSPASLILRKYNSTSHAYTTVPGATITSVTIGGQAAAKVVYSITDGSSLDQDGAANGVIVDPVGVALPAATPAPAATGAPAAPNTGVGPVSQLPPFAALITGGALATLGRRRNRRP